MFRSHKTTTISLLLTVVGLIIPLALACGPADESVQQAIGNSPGTAQDETAEPAAVPTPTLECVYIDGEETCFVSPTPRPNRYGKISGQANQDAHDAEESGARSEVVNKTLSVKVVRNELVEGSKQTITDWLDERDIEYDAREYTFLVLIPAIQLGPLSELEAVRFVDTPTEPSPPMDIQPSAPQ